MLVAYPGCFKSLSTSRRSGSVSLRISALRQLQTFAAHGELSFGWNVPGTRSNKFRTRLSSGSQYGPICAHRPFGNALDPRSMARQIVPNAGEKVYQFRLTEKGSEAPAYFHASAPIYVSALPRCSNHHINLKFSIKRAASVINRLIISSRTKPA
jgi:hypothetical protein